MINISEEMVQKLAETALDMRNRSYVPYSRFAVGAAILGADGKIYTGCNIENAAYGATNCAERTAAFKAISEGCREFLACAVAGGPVDAEVLPECPPCGICRQVLREFGSPDLQVILVSTEKGNRIRTLEQILPDSFGPENL